MPEKTKYKLDLDFRAWQVAAENLGTVWCAIMHDSPTWPIHGKYRCRTCGRQYPVPWDEDHFPMAPAGRITAEPAQIQQVRVLPFQSALVPLVRCWTCR